MQESRYFNPNLALTLRELERMFDPSVDCPNPELILAMKRIQYEDIVPLLEAFKGELAISITSDHQNVPLGAMTHTLTDDNGVPYLIVTYVISLDDYRRNAAMEPEDGQMVVIISEWA